MADLALLATIAGAIVFALSREQRRLRARPTTYKPGGPVWPPTPSSGLAGIQHEINTRSLADLERELFGHWHDHIEGQIDRRQAVFGAAFEEVFSLLYAYTRQGIITHVPTEPAIMHELRSYTPGHDHLVPDPGETEAGLLIPDGCIKTIDTHDRGYQPCGAPVADDSDFCPTHLEQLRSHT